MPENPISENPISENPISENPITDAERLERAQQVVYNNPELLKNRDKIYQITLKDNKPLGITLNASNNYITLKDTHPNPYNIIQYSKLVKFSKGSEDVMLEDLSDEALTSAFVRFKSAIAKIDSTNKSTHVTLTLKSNKVRYSVTLKSNKPTGVTREIGMDNDGKAVTRLKIKDSTYNPYGITDGSRLVSIQYRNFYGALLDGVYMTSLEPDPVYDKFVTKQLEIDTQEEKTYITLNLESSSPDAVEKAEKAEIAERRARRAEVVMKPINAAKNVVRAVASTATNLINPYYNTKPVEVTPSNGGGKSRKTKRHRKKLTRRKTKRHRKKSRRNKKTRGRRHRNKY